MTTRSHEVSFVILSLSTSTNGYMNLDPDIIASWINRVWIIKSYRYWIIVTRCPAIRSHEVSDIMVAISFSGSSPWQCPGMPSTIAAYGTSYWE